MLAAAVKAAAGVKTKEAAEKQRKLQQWAAASLRGETARATFTECPVKGKIHERLTVELGLKDNEVHDSDQKICHLSAPAPDGVGNSFVNSFVLAGATPRRSGKKESEHKYYQFILDRVPLSAAYFEHTEPALWDFLSDLQTVHGLRTFRARLQRYPDKKGGPRHGDRQSNGACTKIDEKVKLVNQRLQHLKEESSDGECPRPLPLPLHRPPHSPWPCAPGPPARAPGRRRQARRLPPQRGRGVAPAPVWVGASPASSTCGGQPAAVGGAGGAGRDALDHAEGRVCNNNNDAGKPGDAGGII